jgi:hypothetical protein
MHKIINNWFGWTDAGGKRPKTRIVQFRFRGLSSSHYMTIGKIELYGQVPQPLGSPEQAYVHTPFTLPTHGSLL